MWRASHACCVGAVEASQKQQQQQQRMDVGEPSQALASTAEAADADDEGAVCGALFRGLVFFLGREVPREALLLVLRSFGGAVGWDGAGSPLQERDDAITHQVRRARVPCARVLRWRSGWRWCVCEQSSAVLHPAWLWPCCRRCQRLAPPRQRCAARAGSQCTAPLLRLLCGACALSRRPALAWLPQCAPKQELSPVCHAVGIPGTGMVRPQTWCQRENQLHMWKHAQIVDRPTQGHVYLGRAYVQPQWALDAANWRVLPDAALYAPGLPPPPHLSPFANVDDDDEGYVPDYARALQRLQVGGRGALLEDELQEWRCGAQLGWLLSSPDGVPALGVPLVPVRAEGCDASATAGPPL